MNPTRPTISIIIPTYNSATYIERTLRSVLAQTFIQSRQDWELLIIDDGSTDSTAEIIAPYILPGAFKDNIRYIKNERNLGISKTRNRGLSEARGKYIAMIDSDDIWLDPKKLELQAGRLNQDDKLGLISTWMVTIDENDNKLGRIKFDTDDKNIRAKLLYKYQITQSSVMFRKQAAAEVGNYDESLATAEDYDLWLKIGVHYKFAILDSFALGYRVHQKSISKKRKVRIALDGLAVVMRHRKEYPRAFVGIAKGIIRLIVRSITPF